MTNYFESYQRFNHKHYKAYITVSLNSKSFLVHYFLHPVKFNCGTIAHNDESITIPVITVF